MTDYEHTEAPDSAMAVLKAAPDREGRGVPGRLWR
jgi:hypothetical protein